jgi:hypothetical protein
MKFIVLLCLFWSDFGLLLTVSSVTPCHIYSIRLSIAVFIFGFIYTPALGWIQNKVFPILFLALARLFCLAESFVVLGRFLVKSRLRHRLNLFCFPQALQSRNEIEIQDLATAAPFNKFSTSLASRYSAIRCCRLTAYLKESVMNKT